MKKKKLSLRRRFPRLLKFGLIIAALAVGIALYRYYFVPQPATIALLVEEGGNNGVTLVQTQAEEKRDTGTIVNKETGKRVRVKKISDTTELNAAIAEAKKTTATGAGTGITAPATTQDPTTIRYGNKEGCESLCKSVVGAKCTEVTSTGSSQGWYCIKDNSLPATNTSINDADMCTVGNTRAAKGSWVATGYGLNENNNHCAGTAPSCPYRECVKVEDDCTTNSKTATKCGDKFAEDPTKVISSSAMGCEYYATAGNTCPTDRPLATCYTSSGAYPSGSKRSDGKICNDGKWVDVPDQKLCDSLYGQGKSIPDSKTNGCKLVVAKATDPCDSLRAQCSNAGKICKVNPTNNVAYCETDPSKLKSAGTVVSSASECASGKATPNAAPLIQGNTGVNGWICTGGKENDIVGTASQCESNFATPTGTPGKVKCQTCKEGINVQDASGRSYYTCEGSKAVYHVCPPGQIRKDYRMAPSECIPDPKLATPAQPEEEKPVSIDPKTLDHLGEECDGTYANKDASGKYTSVPACAQLCDKGVDGKIASKPSNGKIVCDTPKLVADTPPQPEKQNEPTSIDPKTLGHVGEECDGTYANKDASGKYTSVPACAQLCDKGVDGKIASKPSNGKIVCDTPKLVADTPAQPGTTNPTNYDSEVACKAKITDPKTQSCDKNNQSDKWILTTITLTTITIGDPDKTLLSDGDSCGGAGQENCNLCPGEVTKYQESSGTFGPTTKYMCGSQNTVDAKLKTDNIPDYNQSLITNSPNNPPLGIGHTCFNTIGNVSADDCSKCPSGVYTTVQDNKGKSLKICGSQSQVEDLNITDISEPTKAITDSRFKNTFWGGITTGATTAALCLASGVGIPASPICFLGGFVVGGVYGATILPPNVQLQ